MHGCASDSLRQRKSLYSIVSGLEQQPQECACQCEPCPAVTADSCAQQCQLVDKAFRVLLDEVTGCGRCTCVAHKNRRTV